MSTCNTNQKHNSYRDKFTSVNPQALSPADKNQSFCQEMINTLLMNGITKETIAKEVKTSIPTINRILKYSEVNPSPRLFSRLLSLYFASCYSVNKTES